MIKLLLRFALLFMGLLSFSLPLLADTFEVPANTYEVPYEPICDTTCNTIPICGSPTLGSVGLWVDRYLSPTIGAEAFITAWRGYELLDDAVIPSTAGDSNLYMIAGRFGKFFFETLLASTTMVAQHEFFGHGFRAREFGIPVFKYRIGVLSGYTEYSAAKFNRLSPSEQIAFTAGGMEANNILARQIRNKWLNNNCLDSREANLYFINTLEQLTYSSSLKNNVTFSDSHDAAAYINQINAWFGKTVLTAHQLKRRSLIDLADPFLFYSLYSMSLYVFEGSQQIEYPMIPIGNYQYLPALRLALAPYGLEYSLQNYIKTPDNVIQVALKYGNTGGRRSYGLGIDITKIWCYQLLSIDGKIDAWIQPKLFTATAARATPKLGGALSFVARYRVFDKLELIGQVGYKTTGYLPGEVLKHSPILRAGFGAYF